MSVYYIAGFPVSDELYHHGIQGQKWGIRRYQNPDGTLTPEGKKRYSGSLGAHNLKSDLNRLQKEYAYAKGDEYASAKQKNALGVKQAKQRQNELQKQTRQLLSQAQKLNYNVIASPKERPTVRAGEQWIINSASMLAIPLAVIGGPATGFTIGAITGAVSGGAQAMYDAHRMGGYDKTSVTTGKFKVRSNGK